MLRDRFMFKLDSLTDEGGGAGGGAGDGGDGTGDGAGGNGGGSTVSLPELPENWTEGLPDDLKGEPSLGAYKSVADLAKSMVHARRMVGANKVAIPGKHATDDDWNTFYQSIGKPADLDSYKASVELPEGHEFREELMEEFKEQAFNLNIMPGQLSKLLDWYATAEKNMIEKHDNTMKAEAEGSMKKLKSDWGDGYEKNISLARDAFKAISEKVDGAWEWMDKSGLSGNPNMLRIFALVGEQLKEGGIIGEPEGGGKTPVQTQQEINSIMADRKHPYNDKNHPNHEAAVQEVNKMFSSLYSNQTGSKTISI